MAITGLILGVLGLVTFWMWGGFVFGPLAIGAGITGSNEAHDEGRGGEGIGLLGALFGAVALVLTIVMAVVVS